MDSLSNKHKIIYAVSYLIILIMIGTLGFILIDHYTFIDSLYMTIITVSTVGFGEVQALSPAGKLFTAILILMSLGVIAYVFSIITAQFFEGQLSYFLKGYTRKSKFRKMENHVVVCGYGRNGQQAVKDLKAHNTEYIVIDQNHDIIIKNLGKSIRFIEGDATSDEILEKANIAKARALITTMPIDADNLFVTLSARALNPDIIIISRASSQSSEKKLHIAGANNVVMPEQVGGAHMATLVTRPDVLEFLEHLSITGNDPTNLDEISCTDLPESYMHKTIFELDFRSKTGANIVGFKTSEGDYIINPLPSTKIVPNSKLFVLGTPQQIEQMKESLESKDLG